MRDDFEISVDSSASPILYRQCNSESEMKELYATLSRGGAIIDPLKRQFWGSLFAVVKDSAGIRWVLSFI